MLIGLLSGNIFYPALPADVITSRCFARACSETMV